MRAGILFMKLDGGVHFIEKNKYFLLVGIGIKIKRYQHNYIKNQVNIGKLSLCYSEIKSIILSSSRPVCWAVAEL